MSDGTAHGPAWQALRRVVVRNTLSNLTARGAAMVAPLVLTPYIIYVLGLPLFSLWIVAGSVSAYLALLDMGIGVGLTQTVAYQQGKSPAEATSVLLVSSLAFYAVAGLLAVTVAWVAADAVAAWLAIPTDLRAVTRPLLVGSAVVLALAQLLGVAEAVLNGWQLMHITAGLAVAGALLDGVLTVAVLSLGYGVMGLVAKDALLATLLGVARFAYLWRAQPGLSLQPRYFSRGALAGLLRYGLRIQVTRLAEITMTQVDKLLLARFVGLALAGQYEVAARVVRVMKFLVLAAASALMPAAAALHARQERAALQALYLSALRYLVVAAAPAAFFTAVAAGPILTVWLGPGYGAAAQLLAVLSLAHLAHTLTGPGTMILRGVGRPGGETRYTLLLLAASLVFGVLLIGRLGYAGALVATPAALLLSSLYFFRALAGVDGGLYASGDRVCRLPLMAGTVAALAVWPGLLLLVSRLPALALLIGAAVTYLALYTLILWRNGYTGGAGRELLGRLWRPTTAPGAEWRE